MKKIILAVFAACLFLSQSYVHAQTARELTGLEWHELSIGKRMDYLMVSLAWLKAQGADLKATPEEYYHWLDEALRRNPNNYSRSMVKVLAKAIHNKEPQTREVLQKFA